MNTIGLGGGIETGKSTLARAFAQIDPNIFQIESWHPIGEVADQFHEQMPVPPEQNDIVWMNKWLKVLPAIVKDVLQTDCTYEQLRFTQKDVYENQPDYDKFFLHSVNLTKNPELAEHTITDENKPLYRPILQWLGNYMVSRVKPTIWYDEIYDRIHLAERAGAQNATIGGVRYKSDCHTVHEHGDIVMRLIRPDKPEKDSNDPTERERNAWKADITVYNTGEVDDLLNLAPVIWDDIQAKNYKPVYISKA